jgi:secretion/DNA translocation related TadE-like protein
MGDPGGDRGGDRGGVTVLAAVAALTLLVVAALVVELGAAAAARHRAQSAADLAALGAAGAAEHGVAAACAVASDVARRMRVEVTRCVFDGWDATIDVRAGVELGALGARQVTAAARAGPARTQPDVGHSAVGRRSR